MDLGGGGESRLAPPGEQQQEHITAKQPNKRDKMQSFFFWLHTEKSLGSASCAAMCPNSRDDL